MKTNTTIRSIVAMMVIFFAVSITSCKKEENIIPNNPDIPNVPIVPPSPVVPAVSMKPKFIATSENGTTIRKEEYKYDVNGKLTLYISGTSTAGTDSVEMQTNAVTFKIRTGNASRREVLTFNNDKTFSSVFSATDQVNFVNNQTKFNAADLVRTNNTPLRVLQFTYQGNKISKIQSEIQTIDINYFENLPYQKGINEIPFGLKAIKYFKTLDMESVSSSVVYDKLIKQIIINNGRGNFELHDYNYVQDANNRVTKITDTITNTTTTSSTQKVNISIITY